MAPDLALLSSRTHLCSKPTGGARNGQRSVHLRMLKQVLKNKKKRRSKQKPEAVLILFPAALYMAVVENPAPASGSLIQRPTGT